MSRAPLTTRRLARRDAWLLLLTASLAACSGLDDPADTRADLGVSTDASGDVDANTGTDAGADIDAGMDVDAGSGFDAGADVDAGSALDAGSARDAGADVDAGPPDAIPECPTFADGVERARTPYDLLFPSRGVREASGIAESRRNPGVLWLHNDSGSDPRLFATRISPATTVFYDLMGAAARDWEDIAVGPGPEAGATYVYVGDIGDNGESRSNIDVYRVREPVVEGATGTTVMLSGVERFTFVYPDRPHNSETLLVDPRTGDVFVVVKDGDGDSPVYRAAAPLTAGTTTTLELVATLRFGVDPLPGNTLTTGGDISPSGDEIAIRTYDAAYLWRRSRVATVAEALATPPCRIPMRSEPQGEALGFAVDGSGYYSVSEGNLQPISFYARR
jgi:hypothetical protein